MLESEISNAVSTSHRNVSGGADGFRRYAHRAALSRAPAVQRNSSSPAAFVRRDDRSAARTARKTRRTGSDLNPDAGITLPLERWNAPLSFQDSRPTSRRDGFHS